MTIKAPTFFISAVALSIAFSSCSKIEESIQRDIIISTDSVSFTIPKFTDVDDVTTFGTVGDTIDINALIKEKTSDFGLENLQKAEINSFFIKLSDADSINNFQNIENITATISAPGQIDLLVGKIQSISDSRSESLAIPIQTGIGDLTGFLSSPSFKYVLTGGVRTSTTKQLNAKAVFTYTLTLKK